MTAMSKGNKKITTRKIPATNNKVLVHTSSLHFFKKYRQPIEKFWLVLVPICETARFIYATRWKKNSTSRYWVSVLVASSS